MTTRPFAAQVGYQRLQEGTQPGVSTPPPQPPPPQPTVEDLLQHVIEHLDAMQTILADILTELRQQVEKGYTYPLTITTTGLTPVEAKFDPALFSIGLTNDGPGTIQYRIPNTGSAFWIDLFPTEVITFTFLKGVATSAGFRALGADGRIRIVGTF